MWGMRVPDAEMACGAVLTGSGTQAHVRRPMFRMQGWQVGSRAVGIRLCRLGLRDAGILPVDAEEGDLRS